MNITQTKARGEYNDDIKKLIDIFKFQKNEINLKGSSSISVMDYYADYDFFTQIRANYTKDEVYNEFSLILRRILENQECYFMEFKLQNIDGSKHKYYPNDKFKETNFNFSKDTDFCKIDLIYFSNNRFIEASCIYKFYGEKMTEKEYINNIEKDISELKKEKNYYKILKRLYSIYKIEKNENKLVLLTNIFNSELGKTYKDINNIDAIQSIKKYYNNYA